MKIYAAPLQGFTDFPWRQAHGAVAGGVDEYFAPFSRVEKGVAVRPRDVRDIEGDPLVVAQAIFRDVDELRIVVDTLISAGATKIDLNMGCPFPPQVRKGRGAAMVERPDELRRVADLLREYPEVIFSAKMRLGVDDAASWRGAIEILNSMPLRFLTVHPRVARQQYGGELHRGEFRDLLEFARMPVVFNGDILTPGDIDRTYSDFPQIAGVMIGRGLLARPLLASEWRNGVEVPDYDQIRIAVEIHDRVFDRYRKVLCGDAQILQKIKPFWTYLSDILPRRTAKSLHKSNTLSAYLDVLESLRR